MNVVHGLGSFRRDHCLRPVHWILSSTITKEKILISPFEADQLIVQLEIQSVVRLHVYAPKVTETMVSFESALSYNTCVSCGICAARSIIVWAWPFRWIVLDLGLLRIRLCGLLGITTSVIDVNEHINVSVDTFVDRAGLERLGWPIDCLFDRCPIPALYSHI